MYDLGYLQNFDQEAVQPAVDSLIPQFRTPAFDPDRDLLAAVAERHGRPGREHR